jgi:hypothetical protein
MANFSITPPAVPRFDGDFTFAPDPGDQPTPDELAYVAAVDAALDHLAADEALDAGVNYPMQLLSVRRKQRNAAAAALEAEARKLIAGQTAAGNLAPVTDIRATYAATVPKFGTTDRATARFGGDFDVVPVANYSPTHDEQAFLDNIKAATAEFAADKRKDATENFSQNVVKFRELQRQSSADALRAQVDGFWNSQMSAAAAAEDVVLNRGRYQARRDRLKQRLFNVKLTKEPRKTADDTSDLYLDINLLGGLPPPEDTPSLDKQELHGQINRVQTVIRTVCDRMGERPDRESRSRGRLLQIEFLEKLHGIALIGLELEFTALARLTLAELRNEFFVLEAGRIKNRYVRWLGAWAGGAAAAFLAAYIVILTQYPDWQWGSDHRNFLLAACGASVGTWASFSIRQVQFSFEDLAMVEENSLDPPVRVLFVIALTMAACLLFWNGAVNIEIGDLKTQSSSFRTSGSVALLVGLFAGLSERALATAISGRAAAFVRGISGG